MSFVSEFRKILKPLVRKVNISGSDAVQEDALRDFLKTVHPKQTNHDLIRLGGDSDGGYLVPDDLEGISACFSPGVSSVADFELAMADRGIRCFLADYSVDQAPVQNPLFEFKKKFIGEEEGGIFTTLENWVNRSMPDGGDFLLQMDIEGAEYEVFLAADPDLLKTFRIIVIEFHDLDALIDRYGFRMISMVFRKILKDFEVVHIHPNNCSKPVEFKDFKIPPVMEFTFLRHDRITKSQPVADFPHKLDVANVSARQDFPLPECWYEKR